MEFITSEKNILKIIRSLGIELSTAELDLLTFELYKHVDYTRKKAFNNGYNQGRFDQRIEEDM